jgi:hypothetical protein
MPGSSPPRANFLLCAFEQELARYKQREGWVVEDDSIRSRFVALGSR